MSRSLPDTLKPETLSLYGRHLIEASAGTGKTFNITRIYLRLLLERKLDVRNILVMTFTRAATEELRGRIAQEIRHALKMWGQFEVSDEFYSALCQRFSLPEAYPVLHNALLHLDEAAIFTIHGFCKRVLSQQAFSSGVAFNVQMETDTMEIELEAVRDWYRFMAQRPEDYERLILRWADPQRFRMAFKDVLCSTTPIEVISPETIKVRVIEAKKHCLLHLQNHHDMIFSALVDNHKNKLERTEEWHMLVSWLSEYGDDGVEPMPRKISQFFSGSRFSKAIKQQLVELFAPLNQLKETCKSINKTIQAAESYELAVQGIQRIRNAILKAKQDARLMNYDDLVNQLAQSLSESETLAETLRQQYPVALVDEFQDTDPQQYTILDVIYQSHSELPETAQANACALYMIGDPKQAIYAFRSGDVFTYLAARDNAQQQWFMDTNWRSSSHMVKAYNRLFYGAPLQDDAADVFGFDIHYAPVQAAGKADQSPLSGVADKGAMQLAYFPFNEDYRFGRGKKEEMKQDFCAVIAAWCSSEIHSLLSNKLRIGQAELQEQDIAILVRDKSEAGYIQEALRSIGYASVYLSTHDNVFFSEEALELQRVLFSIMELEDDRAMVAGLSTRYINCDSRELLQLQEDETQWESYREQLFDLRETWLKRGFMAMALKMLHQSYIPDPNHHERSLTNSIQLLELLQQASQRHRQPEQLLGWLQEQINSQSATPEAELRLESDANLIRIVTQHGAKGLEYPVVFIPFACRYREPAKFGSRNIDLFKYHDRETRQLQYFIGQDKTITDLYRQEAWAESVRLLYVAITRAQYRCYLCATPFSDYHLSPLGLTLQLSSAEDLYQSLTALLDANEPTYSLQQVNEVDFPVTAIASHDDQELLGAASFHGRIERHWWLSSFSALTRNLRHGGISTPDRDQDALTDEQTMSAKAADDIRFSLTKGAAAGNLLHDILEHTDFCNPNWQRSLERPLARFNEVMDSARQTALIQWLQECLDTCLSIQDSDGSNNDQLLRLNELHWKHTLRETEFYFPMEQLKLQALGRLLARHRSSDVAIQLPGQQELQGMMHGFIDLVFQWRDRFYIADYKSTHLGDHLDCYERSNIQKNIRDNYYDLQYLLYSLALHRYLKTRIPGYDPDQQFGGVYYLYLRGMSSDSDSGIFYTDISSELLEELDELFSSRTQRLSHDL